MPIIFEFTNYRGYLNAWIEALGDRGYGIKGRIAEALAVSSSFVSQVLKGEKTLTSDQASDLVDFMGLIDLESDYFHLLVEFDRSGSHRYREKLSRKMQTLQAQSRKVGKRVPRSHELTDEQRAVFYSSWLYSGIRNLTAVPGLGRAEAIAGHLKLEVHVVARVLRFLLEQGLCKEVDGEITFGPSSTHTDAESPFANKHHQNWRLAALQKMEVKKASDVFYTSPMSLSKQAADEIRRRIPDFIQGIFKISGPSSSETVRCINIDWFEY